MTAEGDRKEFSPTNHYEGVNNDWCKFGLYTVTCIIWWINVFLGGFAKAAHRLWPKRIKLPYSDNNRLKCHSQWTHVFEWLIASWYLERPTKKVLKNTGMVIFNPDGETIMKKGELPHHSITEQQRWLTRKATKYRIQGKKHKTRVNGWRLKPYFSQTLEA